MNVLSAVEMQACDQVTSERYGVAPVDLMRSAAGAVASFVRSQFPRAWRVTVLCGRGNNGGDGLLAARMLTDSGLNVTTLLLGSPLELVGNPADAWKELVNGGSGNYFVVEGKQDLEQHRKTLEADLIIDAVLGTGFKPPLKPLALATFEWLKDSNAPILAVDLPSGWPADSAEATIAGPVFPADAVITFTAPKPAHVFGQLTRRWDQPVVVAQIGSPEEAVIGVLSPTSPGVHWTGSAMEMVQAPRSAEANKGNFGHVLVIGGMFGSGGGRSGAPSMTALAALRSGAGLVTAAVPAPAASLVAAIAPELMTLPLAATAEGGIAQKNLAPEFFAGMMAGKTVLAIGPGMGQAPETAEFVAALLTVSTIPAVIDADALNILAAQPQLLARLAAKAKSGRTLVLTPHPGEMARLAGISVRDVQANRLGVAREFAQRFAVTLVLKGARTLIAHPDGRVAVNTTGNPGMAKGGSGDLLTGLVAGLLAQYPAEPNQAVEAAVYLHGLAADLAVRERDEHTLLATDSLQQLSQAFRFQSRGPNGYVWLQGLPPVLHAAVSKEAPE
jgi:NAD(P)H-hydrate epimerase